MKNHINSYTESYVFLFDADDAAFGGDYGAPCSKMILDAVLTLQQSVHARVYTGDMALAELCRCVFAVKKTSSQSRMSIGVDSDLYISILTELVQSIKNQENVIAAPDLASMMGKHNIFVVTLCGLVFCLETGFS